MTQGSPKPKNTLTELDPVTFPMAESAVGDDQAAILLASVSGSEVPMATSVMPATEGFKFSTHPRTVATSPTIVVMTPMRARATPKAAQPPL